MCAGAIAPAPTYMFYKCKPISLIRFRPSLGPETLTTNHKISFPPFDSPPFTGSLAAPTPPNRIEDQSLDSFGPIFPPRVAGTS